MENKLESVILGNTPFENNDTSEIKSKIHEKYFTRQPQSDFSTMGDLKSIGDKVFFVYKHAHQTREHGNRRDILIVLNSDLEEIFTLDGERHTEHDTLSPQRTDKNFSKPEKQYKEILGIEKGELKILTGNDQTITIKLPKKLFN